jgi:outer membrane protein with beta-barrel domain
MRNTRQTLLILALLLALPAVAAAQSGFEITPMAGYRLSGNVTAYDDRGFSEDTDLQVDESPVYGVALDIPLGYRWQLELFANEQQSSFSVDRGIFDPSEDLGDVDIDFYHVGLLYNWGRGQVNPFLTASIGLARIEPEFADAEDQFSASLAGGVKMFFNDNVGLRLEGRGYWTNFDTEFRSGRRRDRVDEALYQFEGNAGLIIAF